LELARNACPSIRAVKSVPRLPAFASLDSAASMDRNRNAAVTSERGPLLEVSAGSIRSSKVKVLARVLAADRVADDGGS
jgi:hypothetical protein